MRCNRAVGLAATIVGLALAGMAQAGSRPPEAPKDGELAATVIVLKGEVTIAPSAAKAKPFKAADRTELYRSDEMRIPAGGFLVLELHNNYVVKIDEDLVLKVGDLALIDAPKATLSGEEQLKAMVSRRELSEQDRVMGYQNRKAAGEGSVAVAKGAGEEKKSAKTKKEKAPERELTSHDEAPAPEIAAEVKPGGAPGGGHGGSVALQEPPAPKPTPARIVTPASPAPPPPSAVTTSPAPAVPAKPQKADGVDRPEPVKADGDVAPRLHDVKATNVATRPAKAKATATAKKIAWAVLAKGKLENRTDALAPALLQDLSSDTFGQCLATSWEGVLLERKSPDAVLLRVAGGKVVLIKNAKTMQAFECPGVVTGQLVAGVPDGWIRVEIPQ